MKQDKTDLMAFIVSHQQSMRQNLAEKRTGFLFRIYAQGYQENTEMFFM
jgi:hypothetical protein